MSVVLGMMSLQLWPQKQTNVLHQLAIPSCTNAMAFVCQTYARINALCVRCIAKAKLTSICCYCCQFDAACVSIWYPFDSYSMIVCAYLFTSDWWPVMPDVKFIYIYTYIIYISHISNWFAFMQKQWELRHLCLKCVLFSCIHTKSAYLSNSSWWISLSVSGCLWLTPTQASDHLESLPQGMSSWWVKGAKKQTSVNKLGIG